MDIVILDGYTQNPGDLSWAGFAALGALTVYDRTAPEDTARRIGGAEVVITNKTLITEAVLNACPHVRYIGLLSTGYNVVDIEAAARRGIPVTNIPAYGTKAVAQFAFAMLLEICHHVADHDRAVHEGRWANSIDFCFWDYPLIELLGKTMGIVGLGRIGSAVARIARAMGMHVIATSRTETDEGRALAEYVKLPELLRRADVVSLNCPLDESTKGIIHKGTLALMKPSAILLNNGRGALVVEADLADALNEGLLYAAAVDVVSVEPIAHDNPLLKAKHCLITPHISWAAKETRARLMDRAVANLRVFLEGQPLNVVNQTMH